MFTPFGCFFGTALGRRVQGLSRLVVMIGLVLAPFGVSPVAQATPNPTAMRRNAQLAPKPVTFTQVSGGWEHTCGVKATKQLACWGGDWAGQATSPAGSFIQVGAGFEHSCAVKTNGAVVCWGTDSVGQATPPAGLFAQVTAGDQHSCGLKRNGTLACWGDNSWGQTAAPAGTFSQMSAGTAHTCAIKSDGTVACWGDNNNGQATPPAGTFTQHTPGWNFHPSGGGHRPHLWHQERWHRGLLGLGLLWAKHAARRHVYPGDRRRVAYLWY